MYTTLYFNGYKSFPNSRTTTLPDIKHCNVIIGKNNSGKSSLLDVVAASVDVNYFKSHQATIHTLEADFLLDRDSLGSVFSQFTRINNVLNPQSYAEKALGSLYRVELTLSSLSRFSMSRNGNDLFRDSPLSSQWEHVANNIGAKESNNVFRRISAERNISPEPESQEERVEEDGRGASNLIRKIINYSGYDETLIEHTLLCELNKIMKPEIEFEEIKIQQIERDNAMLWEVFLREKGYNRYALSQSGSGLKTIVLVLLNLLVIPETKAYKRKHIVFGFEELENNLHPALQRRLFDYIYDFSVQNDRYVFLTTHSHIAINTFYNKSDANIYHVTKDASGSAVKKIDNYLDKVEILDDLDVKASDLLQSNGIIWVEGPSDRVYIKHWLNIFCGCKYEEGRDYQFMYYGGRLLSHYSTEQTDDLINILTTNRHAAIIMDSDKRNKSAPINGTKKRIVKEFSDLNMFAWITKGKEIENYIPANAIALTLKRDSMAECGQYELFPDYICEFLPNFSSEKIRFANQVVKNITAENSKNRLDLQARIQTLYKQISSWNS